jgi:Xaa-Pro aminopeptidase
VTKPAADTTRWTGIADMRHPLQDRAAVSNRVRRVPSSEELEGVRRAQAAAVAALGVLVELLRAARPVEGRLLLDREPLTSESLREAALAELRRAGADAGTITVAHGEQAADADTTGSGELAPGEPIVLDLYPRDARTGCHGDIARTVVVGDPPEELVAYHRLCREALEATARELRAGADAGALTRAARLVLHGNAFGGRHTHPLGHGVGRDPHTTPLLDEGGGRLAAGDVVAVEPGLYRLGFGGCRLEDLFLVGERDAERIAEAPFDLRL